MNSLVGIDPGTHTGIAFWNRQTQKLDALQTLDFWATIRMFNSQQYLKEVKSFYIEDPKQIKPIFGQNRMTRKNAIAKAQSVGAVKREAELLIQGLRAMGHHVVAVKPSQSKLPQKQFSVMTGHYATTNQHQRDAAMLVFGRKK